MSAPAAASESAAQLARLIMGFRPTQLIFTAAKLRLADHVAAKPLTPEKLAEVTGAKREPLKRLLRALASLGLFEERGDGAFATTALGALLRSDAAGSLRNVALLYGEQFIWQAYGQTYHSVMTGEPGFERAHGEGFYDYLGEHADAADLFNAAMSGFSAQEAAAIIAAYDFSNVATVIDVGGGEGKLAASLVEAHPHLSAIVFDLPATVSKAAAGGARPRVQFAGGDFFDKAPRGGDLYLLKSVLHNWRDDDAVRILATCRKAMGAEGRLLVIERVIPPGNEPSEAKLFDINMLVVVGGLERTQSQYAQLFERAGLALTRVTPTAGPMSLVEAKPAEG
jgi:ubiquinone/menaquinone biosynthesis C-methylase UbiE